MPHRCGRRIVGSKRLKSAAVDPDQPAGRRTRIYVVVLAAVGLVAFSWLTPEPKTPPPRLPDGIEQGYYNQCARQNTDPPEYGDRTLASGCDR